MFINYGLLFTAKANWCTGDIPSHAALCCLVWWQYVGINCKWCVITWCSVTMVTTVAGVLPSLSHKEGLWWVWAKYLPPQPCVWCHVLDYGIYSWFVFPANGNYYNIMWQFRNVLHDILVLWIWIYCFNQWCVRWYQLSFVQARKNNQP